MNRIRYIDKFYCLLSKLEERLGGTRLLAICDGNMGWPERGIYFFFEPGEFRSNGKSLRVVRVGTHALKSESRSSLWDRLRQHRGTMRGDHPGGGDHRGSVFRLHVGSAILNKEENEDEYHSWGRASSSTKYVRDVEYQIEKKVSKYIRSMPFLWLRVSDRPGPDSMRGYLERNSIALLSNFGKLRTASEIDPPSKNWLGYHAWNMDIQKSGLWNSNHTNDYYEPDFLDLLAELIKKI